MKHGQSQAKSLVQRFVEFVEAGGHARVAAAPFWADAEGSRAAVRAGATPEGVARRAGGAASPRAVTRGESFERSDRAQRMSRWVTDLPHQVTKIDWLHATWECKDAEPQWVAENLFKGPHLDRTFHFEVGGGIHGFKESLGVFTNIDGDLHRVAQVAYGGESQRGRAFLQLTGEGCAALGLNEDMRVRDALHGLLAQANAKVTRLDLAFDTEELAIRDCLKAYRGGEFGSGGKQPSCSVAGDWIDHQGAGRTLYVGKSRNGKLCRCYEKGKQLGDKDSKWLRLEVQFGARDRVIPLEALRFSDAVFSGANRFFERVSATVPRIVETVVKGGEIVVDKLVEHAKTAYGALVHQLAKFKSAEEIVHMLRVEGAPRRMKPFLVSASGSWPPVPATEI